ncbi:MAG: DUF1285 domain-containing protein [Ketobacter sp.]
MMDSTTLNTIAEQIEGKSKRLPPIEKWNPDFSGDLDMRIARDGRWYYLGSEIKRSAMVKLFSTILLREDDEYFLVTPVEKYRIVVEVAPFIAISVQKKVDDQSREPALVFETNVGDWVVAGPDNPIRVVIDSVTEEPTPLITVRRNLEALISRNVFYQLVDQADVEQGETNELYVTSLGSRFSLGKF